MLVSQLISMLNEVPNQEVPVHLESMYVFLESSEITGMVYNNSSVVLTDEVKE